MSAKTTFTNLQDKVDEFIRKGPRSKKGFAVFLTFDFDPDAFLRVFGKVVKRYNVLVLADERGSRTTKSYQHDGYFFAQIRKKQGVFHPKGFLLVNDDRTLASVGSGNLTKGGLGGNLECVVVEEAKIVDPNSLPRDLAIFLNAVLGDNEFENNKLVIANSARNHIKEIIPFFNLKENEKATNLIHNLGDTTLLEQMGTGDRIKIISPWHTQSNEVTEKIEKRFSNIGQILTDCACEDIQKISKIYNGALNSDDEYNQMPATLHAKVYLITKNRIKTATFFFGSANCTQPALCATVKDGGNVELLYRSVVKKENAGKWWEETSNFFRITAKGDPSHKRFQCGGASKTQIVGAHIRPKTDGKCELILETNQSIRKKSVFIRYTPSIKGNGEEHNWENSKIRIPLSGTVDKFSLEERVEETWVKVPVSVLPSMWTKEPISFEPQSFVEFLDDILDRPYTRNKKLSEQPKKTRHKKDDSESDDDKVNDTLTKCDHEGYLDKVAVRAHLLKQKLKGDGIEPIIENINKYSTQSGIQDYQRTAMEWLVEKLKEGPQ